jgi:peroxiredoxin
MKLLPYSVLLTFLTVNAFLHSTLLSAQANVLVTGQILNHNSLIKTVELRVNNRYVNNEVDLYESNLLKDGTFAFAVAITEPQYVTISYSQNTALIYLEPNDSLSLVGEGSSFPHGISFAGKGGAHNRYLYKYLGSNPQEIDPFKKIQYKKGTYWFVLDPGMDNTMKNNHPEAFKKLMLLRREQSMADLNFNASNRPEEFSTAFREFMSTEIFYDWAYHVMLYGAVFKNKHGLTESYFSFLDEVPLQSETVGNYHYRDFLMAYLNYLVTKNNDLPEHPYLRQYEAATEILSGRALAFAQSEIIYRCFGVGQIDEILSNYWAFVEKTDYPEFSQKVVSVYEKAMKQSIGVPAPDFKLMDNLGRMVTLRSYNGQVVLLNFWASWCQPCMSKMRIMQPLEAELKSKGIVFMNVSLDRDTARWQQTLSQEQFAGVHLIADGDINSSIANEYQVRILPQYFLIDKNGAFAEKPKQFRADDLRLVLNRLSR